MDKRILNPRTNRYVTLGSPSYRKLLREGVLTANPPKASHQPIIIEDSDSDLDDTMFSRKPMKKEKPSH